MKKEKYTVTGMTCAACSAAVERAVGKVEGVSSVTVNLLSNSMVVEYDENLLEPSQIVTAVSDAGYLAAPASAAGEKTQARAAGGIEDEIAQLKTRVVISLVFMVLLMYVAMGPMVGLPLPSFLLGLENAATMALVQLLLTLPVLYVNRAYFQMGLKTLCRRSPNMDSLIAIGSGAAVAYGIFALFRISYGPVSYTHLDVYKRQVKHPARVE